MLKSIHIDADSFNTPGREGFGLHSGEEAQPQ